MLRLVELLGAIRDFQECSRELPGTFWGALGELSGSPWELLGPSGEALGDILGVVGPSFGVRSRFESGKDVKVKIIVFLKEFNGF